MGSSGSGSFGNYRIGQNNSINENTGRGIGGGMSGNGGMGGERPYPSELLNIKLEDVAISEFFENNETVPDRGYSVFLDAAIYNGRLVVRGDDTDEILGNVPTQYNYLITYLKKGVNYTGTVISSGVSPIPFIVVNLHE